MCSTCAEEAALQTVTPAQVHYTKTMPIGSFDMKKWEAARANRSKSDEEILGMFGYHAGTLETQPRHRAVRTQFIEMATFLDSILPPGRIKDVAFIELETASMWANKAIAEAAPVVMEVDDARRHG